MAADTRLIVYTASRASIPERAAMWRAYRRAGARIISSWIDQDGPGETPDFGILWTDIQTEIMACQRLVLYAEPGDFPLKGALIEVGMAIGMRKPIWVLGSGITLEGRTDRPFGSWIRHPLVEHLDVNAHLRVMSVALGM